MCIETVLSFIDASGTYQATLRTLQTDNNDSVERGEVVFLNATFGNEDFFGAAIGLHELLNNLSPSAAVGVGAQIDITRVPLWHRYWSMDINRVRYYLAFC